MAKDEAPEDSIYWFIDLKEDTPKIHNVPVDYFRPKDKVFQGSIADPRTNLCGVYVRQTQKMTPQKSQSKRVKAKSPSRSPYKNPRLMTSVSVQRKAKEFDAKNKTKMNKNFNEKQKKKSVVSKNYTSNTSTKSKSRNRSIKHSGIKTSSGIKKSFKKSKTLMQSDVRDAR